MAKIKLYKSKDVTNGTESSDDYVPPDGKKFYILEMHGSAAFSKNSVVKLIWDYGGADNVIWSLKGDGHTPDSFRGELIATGNGVKKLSLVLDNGETTNVVMSGLAWIKVED